MPYFFITRYLTSYNYKEQDGAKFLAVVGGFNTLGMVILGYIGDKPWLHISKTYGVCLISKENFKH